MYRFTNFCDILNPSALAGLYFRTTYIKHENVCYVLTYSHKIGLGLLRALSPLYPLSLFLQKQSDTAESRVHSLIKLYQTASYYTVQSGQCQPTHEYRECIDWFFALVANNSATCNKKSKCPCTRSHVLFLSAFQY